MLNKEDWTYPPFKLSCVFRFNSILQRGDPKSHKVANLGGPNLSEHTMVSFFQEKERKKGEGGGEG